MIYAAILGGLVFLMIDAVLSAELLLCGNHCPQFFMYSITWMYVSIHPISNWFLSELMSWPVFVTFVSWGLDGSVVPTVTASALTCLASFIEISAYGAVTGMVVKILLLIPQKLGHH